MQTLKFFVYQWVLCIPVGFVPDVWEYVFFVSREWILSFKLICRAGSASSFLNSSSADQTVVMFLKLSLAWPSRCVKATFLWSAAVLVLISTFQYRPKAMKLLAACCSSSFCLNLSTQICNWTYRKKQLSYVCIIPLALGKLWGWAKWDHRDFYRHKHIEIQNWLETFILAPGACGTGVSSGWESHTPLL